VDLGQLGPYRLLSELGRGGMGIVYRAFDEALGRVVAVKVLRPDQAEPADRHRLVREAQHASRFQNDHVVTIHAVVDPPDGLPYLVMEHVPGRTLAERIGAEPRPEPRQVATWLAQVADALHAAHAAGLIHRAVKPSNILIDDRTGRAKITDFGLARAQSGQSRVTREGFVAGTPTYMSPEQARGQSDLDARSDIYSLGSTLYEALTGVTAYRGAPHLVLRQVIEEDPRPLRQLNDRTPRDLETICLKAMAREPARRYQAAAELADDLRRWLRGEPIHARPAGRPERTWRWCRRNPRVAGLATSLVFVLAAGFLGIVWQWRRAEANAARAENQAARADRMRLAAEANLKEAQANFLRARRAVDQFYTKFYEHGVLNVPGQERIRQEVLGEMMQYYKDFLDQHQDDPSLRRELAETCYRLGRVTSDVGSAADALALLRRALRDFELLALDSLTGLSFQDQMLTCINMIGQLENRLGDDNAARRTYQRGIDLAERILRQKPEDNQYRRLLAAIHGNLARVFLELRDSPQAREAYHKALDLQKELARRNPEDLDFQNDLAMTYNNICFTVRGPHEAEPWHLQALEIRKHLVERAPTSNFFRRNLARTYQNLGLAQRDLGRPEDARKSFEESRRLLEQVVSEQPAVKDYQHDLGQILMILGNALAKQGRYDEAKALLQRSHGIFQRLHHASPGDASYEEALQGTAKDLAQVEKDAKSAQPTPRAGGATPASPGAPPQPGSPDGADAHRSDDPERDLGSAR
jgi:tetratricopeptide (TPR) repeat protein